MLAWAGAVKAAPTDGPAGAARRCALRVVLRALGGEFLSRALNDELAESRLSGQDRSLVTDLAYGTLRYLLALDTRLAPLLRDADRLPADVRGALRIGSYELVVRGTPAYAAVDAWVDVTKSVSAKHAKLVNAVLRRVAASDTRDPLDGPQPERDLSLPRWLFDRFVNSVGRDAASRAAEGMLEPEPLWLTAFGPMAEESLRDQGVELRDGPVLPAPSGIAWPEWPKSLSVRSPLPLRELNAFTHGLVQPQNPASLYAAKLLGTGRGDVVYDLAAGHGVKTATLAAAGASVVAVEVSQRRSRAAQRNLRRLGLEAEHVVADLLGDWPDDSVAPGDAVLLDAPCSGTGTLRGNPEIKLRLREEDLGRMATTQSLMLEAAARAVRPGGTLVYAVCSLTPEEGVRQIERFLSSREDFSELAMPVGGALVAAVGSGSAGGPGPVGGPGAYVLPVDGLDGFYLARLRRER